MATKKSISKNIALKLNTSFGVSDEILNTFLDIVKINTKDKKVKISEFGNFYYKLTPERAGRNPKTGDSYIICSRNKLNFKPSNKIKNLFNN